LTASSPRRGRFITFEGGEGAGKSTQIRRLADNLKNRGYEVVLTREPGGSPGAEAIRTLLVEGDPGRWDGITETLLFAAARRDHVERTIRPALARGAWVLCDRFSDSTIAYQGYGAGVDIALVRRLSTDSVGDILPDLTLILDLPVEAGLARAAQRSGGEDRFERKGIEFHNRLREGFLAIAKEEPNRCAIVNATGTQDAIAETISKIVSERLNSAA
jgi:dTMP kinase